ncbi:hypothetical protein OIV19_18455 [Brucella sp. HL-2]|nr:hypothetical protein [Brucella sp. HL-2]MCV9909586.1 hypothetical protein [Brucella sp. HL-2]
MRLILTIMFVFNLIGASVAQDVILDQTAPVSHIDPPRMQEYQRERKIDETKKYVDPILREGVDVSALEVEVLKRRMAKQEEKTAKLTDALNAVIVILNEMNGVEGKK